METSLIERIDALRIYLKTSAPVKLQEVVDTWNEFCEAIGKPHMKKQSTGCISCLRTMLKTMVDHIDKLTHDASKDEEPTAKPRKKNGSDKRNPKGKKKKSH